MKRIGTHKYDFTARNVNIKFRIICTGLKSTIVFFKFL